MKSPDQIERRDNTPERIQAAALRYKGQVFTGPAHSFAHDKLEKVFPSSNNKEIEQGFITNSGRFVNREDAFKIAQKAKQVESTLRGQNPKPLISENL